jgi:hypothetical protein
MYFLAPVTKWLTQKDGTTRVHALDKTGVHGYLLNTDRIFKLNPIGVLVYTLASCDSTLIFCDNVDITCDSSTTVPGGYTSSFWYDERPLDKRESLSYIEANVSANYIKTVSERPFLSKFLTIPVYKDNVYGKPLTNITIQSDCIIYAHAHSDSSINASWILYGIHDFKKVRVLSSLSLADIIDLVTPYPFATTTEVSTTTLFPGDEPLGDFHYLWVASPSLTVGDRLYSSLSPSPYITINNKDFATDDIPESSVATFSLVNHRNLIDDDSIDNIWFGKSERHRHVTTEELISYNLRSCIKYNHSTPFDIDAIGIPKLSVDITDPLIIQQLSSQFELWIFWTGLFSDYGYFKDNRLLPGDSILKPLFPDYYVKNGGNDLLDGTTEASAWAHHPWMSDFTGSVTLLPGDVIGMQKGDTWTIASPSEPFMTVTQNGTVGNHITTTAYGTGALPVINISTNTTQPVIYSNGNFFIKFDSLHISHYGAVIGNSMQNGITLDGTVTSCHDIIITNCEINNLPGSGIVASNNAYNIYVGDDDATTQADQLNYSNNIHHFGYAGVLLVGSAPVTLESNFYVYYNYIHDGLCTTPGDNEYGIVFSASATSNSWPNKVYCRYNYVENILTWHGIDAHGGREMYFEDNYIDNCTFGVSIADGFIELTPTCDHIYVRRNTLTADPTTFTVSYFIVFESSQDTTQFDYLYVDDNIIAPSSIPAGDYANGIRMGNVNHVSITGNSLYNGPPIWNSGPAINIFKGYSPLGYNKNITISGNFINQWGMGISMDGDTIKGLVDVNYNIIIGGAGHSPCFYLSNANLDSAAIINLFNNTLIIKDLYAGLGILSYQGQNIGSQFNVKNNIIIAPSATDASYVYLLGAVLGTLVFDNNLYWNSIKATPFLVGGTAYNFAGWQGAGYDINGINGSDPLFVNAAGYSLESDFVLQAGSPVINNGVDVGLSEDYFGNSLVGLPDIGATEYQ